MTTVLVVLVVVPSASAAGFYEAKRLEPAAAFVAKKPVKVWCASNAAAWSAWLTANNDTTANVQGATYPGTAETHLSPTVCANLALQLAYGGEAYLPLAPSIETLTHESILMRGETDEGITDCDAMHEMPGVAVRFFNVKAGKQLRALMASAWVDHRRKSAIYQSQC